MLLQAVRRNMERFPPDFMFELSAAEWTGLRSQFVRARAWEGRLREVDRSLARKFERLERQARVPFLPPMFQPRPAYGSFPRSIPTLD